MMKPATKLFYEFGEFRLDTEKHRLLRDAEIVTVTPKAVETLTLLIQQRGRLVERDVLMNSVWREANVEPGNLDVTISKLRKALGERGNGRKFIETVPRLGYKFVADVREVTEEVPSLIVEKHTIGHVVIDEEIKFERERAVGNRISHSIRAIAAVSILAIIAIAIITFALLRARNRAAGPVQMRSVAVLPLKSFASDPDDKSLRLGFADALITSLARINEVKVISINSVGQYLDSKKEPAEIGRDL